MEGNNTDNGTNDAQKSEQQRAADNNAKNIQNAAEVAIASKNPYAMAAGAAVKYGDKLTGGKISKGLGSATERLNRHNPMGKKVQKASNKLAESGASDKIGQAAAMKNGMGKGNPGGGAAGALKSGAGGNKPQASNVGQEKLKSSSSNRSQNFMKNRKKRQEDAGGEENQGSGSNDDNNQQEDGGDGKGIAKKLKKIKLLISIISALLPIIAIVLIVVIIVSSFSSLIGLLGNFLFNQPDKEELFNKWENRYYERLQEIKKEYKDNCGNEEDYQELDTNYFHVVLYYQYYIQDDFLDEIDENACVNIDSDNPTAECVNAEELERKAEEMVTKLNQLYDYFKSDMRCKRIDYSRRDKDTGTYGNLYKLFLDVMTPSGQLGFYRQYIGVGKEYATSEDLLDEIFDYAEGISSLDHESYSEVEAIPDTLAVDNKDANKSILIKDYLAGVIYANVDKSVLTNPERLKAYTVVYTTNIMSKNTITVNTQSISSDSIKNLTYCDPNSDCNGRGSISDLAKNTVTNAINEVYGNVLVDKDGKYVTLSVDKLNDVDSDSFTLILSNAYEGYTLRNAKEDVYDNGVNYGNEKVLTDVIFYDQTNYTSSFCGLKNETIKSSGCGTTSMAIITSTYENSRQYDPVYMAEEARKQGHCSRGNGTYYGHFKYIANKFHYKYLAVKKTSDVNKLNTVTSHLRQGHLIVVHVGAGHFTSGGHYMVLGGIDPATKSVYVYDPYNKVNKSYRKTGNGWYKFNDILKETKPSPTYTAFQIIWKDE